MSYLFDGDADPHWVYGPLNQDLLLLIAAYDHRLQQKLFAAPVLKHVHWAYIKIQNTRRMWA